MSDSQNDPWLCYGDYICLSTRAGKDTQERKYLFGHSSPLMQLQNVRKNQSATDFASIILAENPATVACADKPDTSNEGTFDAITNARDYWFEVLPRTDYDMTTQLSSFKKQLSEANKRLSQLQTKKKDVMAKRKLLQQHAAPNAQSTPALNFASTSDIHMSSKPPNDAVVNVGDSSNLVEMQPFNSASALVSPAEVTVKGMQPAAPPSTKSSVLSKMSLGNMGNIGRRQSVFKQSDSERDIARETAAILSDIESQTAAIEALKARVTEFKAKMKQEQNGNVETIKRMHGDPLTYGSVVQLSHVSSKRLLTFTKVQDRPLELAEYGKQGSLFFIERVSTGVAGGTAKIPAQGSNAIRLKSLVSDSQYVRMEPNNYMVPGTKFGVSLDVELDGVFSADECFQLGTGAASSNDNRVDWIIERCKKNSKVSGVEDGNAAEDDGVAVDEVLSGCQIIRVYHRASESYLAATATKMDRGKVFWSHKSQSDASQGSGKISNTYWMVIDGDGDMADSGEDVNGNSPVFLQHVVSGMLLVCIRHLPAMDYFKATYSEEYLSDDEENENQFDDGDEKLIIQKRDELDHWIQTIRTSVSSVLEYCKKDILPSQEKTTTLSDLTSLEYLVGETVPWHSPAAENGEDEAAALGRFQNDVQEYKEYRSANEDQVVDENGELDQVADNPPKKIFNFGVELWNYRGETLSSMLKDAVKFLFEEDDLTVESIKIKALEIEYELFAWFRMPVFMEDQTRYIRAYEVVDFALKSYKADESAALDNDDFTNPFDYTPSESGGVRMSGGKPGSVSGGTVASGARMVAEQQFASSVASVPDSTVIRETGSIISVTASRANASETASMILNDQNAQHPLETLDKIIALFKVRDTKNNLSASVNPWTMHVMTPKRLRNFRAKFDDRFSLDTSSQGTKEDTSKFLLACRWSFSTRHDKSERKVDEDLNLSNNTLFGVEAIDCKDEIVVLGSDLSITSSLSASTTKHVDISMVQVCAANIDKKTFFESPTLQQFEQQLCNIEFVSPKNADKIRNGAQVSSIIRNFCAHLKYATDKHDLGDSDLEYYIAFVRRYNSRLQEAFDVVARSCRIDGFQPGNTSTATDSQGQLFFGSLGIVELAFSVIQSLTEQLGWQIEEPPPFFTHWKVRPHHAKVLHYCLEAISDTTMTFPKNKADGFFKKWRQRRDKDGQPCADGQMSEVTREALEELGFPPLRSEAGVEQPRVTHNVFKLFADSIELKPKSWTDSLVGLKMPESFSQGANVVSPKTYVEAVMKKNFPKATVQILTKKVEQVERKFKLAFDLGNQDDDDDQEATAYTKNEELWDSLTYAMKPSDFDFFRGKYVAEQGLLAFKAILSPVQASRIRSVLERRSSDIQLDVRPGEQTFYLLKPVEDSSEDVFTFSNLFKGEFLPNLISIIKDGKVLEFDQEKANLLGNSVEEYDEAMIKMMCHSQLHLARILKCIALDDDNAESPWNDLPIFFDFKDNVKYSDFRPILVDIIKQACSCVSNLLKDSEENSKKINSPQVYYVIKNLLPNSSANQLNIPSMLASILRGNFSVVDRMFTDAVYSSLLESMNDLRSSAIPIILRYLVENRDGTPDYAQQLRVLKSIFQNPYDEGRVLIPRVPASYVGGTFKSLRLVFDSTYGLAKTKSKPSPKDHPFAYITPPPWAKTADGDKRSFIEAWDVLVPVTKRSGTLGRIYGPWCLPRFFELKTFAHDFDCSEFGYFSEIKKIETEWNEVHSKTMDEDALSEKERNLKRDWWYCTMKLHLQYLCSCYSLVAKLCANRNQQALDFFYGKQFQTKDQFLVQSWGSRPTESIVSVENDGSFINRVSFGVDGCSTVAALTHLKPMIPSCGFEFEWYCGRLQYYEVTIESFEGPATKAMLQLGWTHANKERNADSPSDGNGAGDFPHSWGMDCIRAIPYDAATKLKTRYETEINENRATLVKIVPEAESLTTPVDDLHGPKLQEYLDKISELWNAKADSMRQGPSVDEAAITKTRREVEKAKHLVRSRVSHRKNIMAQMAAAQRKYEAKDAKEKAKDKLEKMLVDQGLMCYHAIIPDAEVPDVSSAFLSESMEATLKNDPVNKKTGQPSFRWVKNTVIGVWYDYDTREMGIVRSEDKGGRQTCFRRSDTAFFEDLNSVSWADDIVPCITGKGVNIKVNLGIVQGEGNNFKFLDSLKLNWVRKVPSPSFSISEIKDGKMITDGPHGLKHGQNFRLEFAKTTITPQRSSSPSGDIDFDHYTYESHRLQNNQLVMFIDQETSSNGIEKGQVYLVKVQDENPNDFSLRKLNLRERAPYRVVLFPEDPPNTFDFVRVGEPDETLISDPLQLPRVYLNGKVPRAVWAPYDADNVDVTGTYNQLYDDGLRSIGNLEAVCEENSVLYKQWGNKTSKNITGNLKDFFKPEQVAIQASEHPERKGVYICDDHGLKKGQLVQFDVQLQPNGIIPNQGYTVNLDNVSDSNQFRLTKFLQDETCFLRVYYSLKLPDTLIGDSQWNTSGKVARLKQKSLKYSPCLSYTPPSNMTRQKIPNYAFSNGIAVMPDYNRLCDIIFCDFLPACLRSSCVELLRSCFIDQEPWFLTPPINTIRAISDEAAVPLIKFAGGYPGKTFRDFARRHNYKVGKQLPQLADDHFGYCEDDENFFQDVYDAAGWEQSQTKKPSDFGNKNWSDGSGEQALNIYEPLRNFLLRGYRSPKDAPFELSTRDITIFWGQASCLLWEKSLKSRFLSEKNQDIKTFLKNLINVLQDTLLFQFDESWKGILKVRKRLVGDLELCALSYFEQTDIAHVVAHAIQESQRLTPSDSTPVAATSRTGGLLSCFRRSSESTMGAVNKDDVKDEEQTVQGQYSSPVPQSVLEGPERLQLVSNQSSDLAKRYSEYSLSQGGKESYEYFDWFAVSKTTPIPDYKPSAFSFNQLEMMFKQSSGDLLLAFCDLMSVSWQIMVDDKITEFLDLCGNWQNETSSLVNMSNVRIADLQAKRIETTLMKLARDFFDKEKSNSTKSKIDFTDEHDQERNDWVDWFQVIPTLANIPRTATMASRLCIQLHAFPKDVFESIQKTQIVTGQDSEIISKLEVELRILRALKDSIRLCFFAEEDLLELDHIPNEVSFNLGESWKCVERLIAQLCLEKEYDDSTAELQSWVDPKAARLFVPCDEEDPRYQKLFEIVDSSGGIPLWEESLEYIEMLHDSITEAKSSEKKNWDYQKAKSPFFMILPEKGPTDQGPTWQECMKVYSQDQDILDEGQEKSIDNSPCQMEYQCFICNQGGSGYCFCFPEKNVHETTETTELKFVHPECVYRNNLAGKRYQEPRDIPQSIEEHYQSLYVSNKADQDATWSTERRALVVDEIKKSILDSCDVDKESKAIQKPYLDSFKGVEPATKKDQLQKAMMQLGIIDQLIQIVKIQFPKKYTREQADDYNYKMQKRMQSRRINYLFDKVNANSERITIVECLMRRVFCLLAQVAAGSPSIQDCLYTHVDFFFSKALEPNANDSALCILNMVQGNFDNATAISTDLLVSMVRVAQDGQNPDDILLLAPFMAQGGKNIAINQREILELCIPAEYAVREDCMFILDSDFPSESTTKESFEKWKSRITSLHVTAEKSKFGENPWDLKEHNWRHLLRISSDIVHGGYASKSEPCRSAFHMAFIQTLMACGFNNPEERQNIVLRLPVVQILHVLNTVCSVVHHRIWGFSFIERCKNSLETSVQDLVKVDPKSSNDLFPRDPRLNFMNFDMLLAGKSRIPTNISVLPLCGLLKFLKCYMDLLSNVHFFNDSGSEDLVRRTSEGLPLFTSSKVSGFITWMGIVLKDVVSVFQRKKRVSEVAGAGVLGALGSQVTLDNAAGPPLGAVESDKNDEPGVDGASEAAPVSTGSTPNLSFGALSVVSRFKAKAHSYIHARPFADFDKQWYHDNGDISDTEFDQQSHHPIMSAALNQIWSKINGLGVNWETPTMQGLKLADKLAYDSRTKDIMSSPKFCRPHWRCPISHAHFVNENLSVLALAVSCVLFDQVPMDWKSGAPPGTPQEKDKPKPTPATPDSILGAILSEGYKGQKRPNGSDIDEARDFILAIELLIQEMCANPNLRWHNKKTPAPSYGNSYDDPHSVEIIPVQVLEMLTENFDEIKGIRSFKESAGKFEKYLHKDPESIETSWPAKLLQSGNETSAIVLIEKKISHWNIIRIFRASLSDGNPLYNHISTSQAPVIRRCLSFALVSNWGGWGGLGSEVSLKKMNLIVESIGDALADICHIAIETLPSFIQQLFQRFEAPKAGSPQAKECIEVGDRFLQLAATLQENRADTKQADCITKICAKPTNLLGSPLDYLVHVGETLKKAPKQWSQIESFTLKTEAIEEPQKIKSDQSGDEKNPKTGLSSVMPELRNISIQDAYKSFLRNSKIQEIVSSTLETNSQNLLFRFLAIDPESRTSPVSAGDLPFSFYSKSSLRNSLDRNDFPKYLNRMVYNLLSVLESVQFMSRGEDTNYFIISCLRTLTQVIFCGACVDKSETEKQFGKLARNKLVLDHDRDSVSFFARIGHVQECLVGLCWLNEDDVESAKDKLQNFAVDVKNPALVTDYVYKMALKAFSSIANLVTSAAPNNEIREKAMLVLSCLLDNCSASVLDRFFDSKDAQVIHSTSNMFARSLQQFIKDYEVFQDRDDDLTIYFQKIRNVAKQAGSLEPSEDEYIRKLIEFETTDWLSDAAVAKAKGETPVQPDANIKAAYESCSSKGFTNCLYCLRLIGQMCVQSGKTTRASYSVGQKYMCNQPNSDPALVVDFPSSLNSLGSAIAGRMRLAQANVFDIRILCRLFKAYNSIIFGVSASETQEFLVSDAFVLINKTISGLSQRIDDISAPFFPGNHPVYVLEQMLIFLLSFALSDLDGKICKQLGKGISWINFFNLISQMHTASTKYESSSGPTKSQVISAAEYKKAAQRISDSAYILYSAVKRRDILKSAQLEQNWRQANLDAVATEAQRRVSCVEIVRTPGFAELCFFSNPDDMNEVGDNTQRQLLCLEDSKQLSLRRNLVISEQLRNRKTSGSGFGATLFKILRNVPLILTTLINLLLLGWLSLPIDFSAAPDGWKWPQDEFLWERLVSCQRVFSVIFRITLVFMLFVTFLKRVFQVPNITSEDGSYTYQEFQSNLLPNVLPLTLSDEESEETTIYRNGINMTFLLLAGANIVVCFLNLIFWILKKARVDVYEYLLTSAYEDFVSPSNKSKKKISLEDLQNSAGGSSFLTIFKIPAFWGRLAMMFCSLCILLVSPLFSVLFVCDGFRFPGISYIFGAFTAKYKEFLTLGYLTASIIFMNAVIGLVFFWDLFSGGANEAGSSECTTLFQCTLSFIVLGWQGGGLSDLLSAAKDTPQGTPTSIGDPNPSSYRLIISLFWQLLYFVIVPTCLVSTVVGIISDSFGDARQKKTEWKDTMAEYCFVCGRSAADFRDAGLVAGLPEESIVTFEEHVTTEHCVKDYFKLFMAVKSNKNPDLLTAQEHFVLQKINSLDETFFPMDLSISLDAMKSFAESESSAAEVQQKRMDGFEAKLGKVAESVEQVASTMVTQDMTKEQFAQIEILLKQIMSTSLGLKS